MTPIRPILAALALFLTACGPKTIINTIAIPEKAAQERPSPVLAGKSNRAVGVYAVKLKHSLGECNADKAAIRAAVQHD